MKRTSERMDHKLQSIKKGMKKEWGKKSEKVVFLKVFCTFFLVFERGKRDGIFNIFKKLFMDFYLLHIIQKDYFF